MTLEELQGLQDLLFKLAPIINDEEVCDWQLTHATTAVMVYVNKLIREEKYENLDQTKNLAT